MPKKKKKTKNIILTVLVVVIMFLLINFSGKYMGIKETQDFLESRYLIVLTASDICFENNYTFFVDMKNKRAGCTPSIPFQNGTWYIKLT